MMKNKRFQLLLLVVGVIVLSITADKCRQMVGEENSSKSGMFTFLNCFDGGSGTLACVVKEGVKLYANNIRSVHMETKRNEAIESALADALSQGLAAKEASVMAQKEGAKAAKLAKRKAKRIIGPIISSGWDFFEAIYYGGTLTEGFLRGTGTLFGTYAVGFAGEQRLGRFGYLVGSQLGSWIGGRIGLMVYDVVNGIHFMMHFAEGETQLQFNEDASNSEFFEPDDRGKSEEAGDSYVYESSFSSASDEGYSETPSDELLDESGNYQTPGIEAHDEFQLESLFLNFKVDNFYQ